MGEDPVFENTLQPLIRQSPSEYYLHAYGWDRIPGRLCDVVLEDISPALPRTRWKPGVDFLGYLTEARSI